ncbi:MULTISPECIES: restriction endonuclease subunit S [Rhodanobacter]|uniref:restriction endonuclease subunit S n=1 Tax=Rhodanobacter TaxID=75309 RepID=UPI00048427C9|nr:MULTISPECIES: restriction endonuclease subunit S [Rhodanobacter]KZC20081.1 restriction endonuclease [Rhodanobacter denitrificans]UJJ50770.1 restriction endonuclease subunit S [Rhodanobacter denitrificans]UJM93484.1 restriction endonuclease subunit S [Rhodanobacter denitrificans]UJM97015.1 restriction endonuclease subunit S [Rhodanobacter denitrificans]UJN20157.1 restriction endonuclease subunit S [Rhodanobacter denitrificans]
MSSVLRKNEFKQLIEVGSVARGKSRHRPRNDPQLYGGAYPFVQTGDVKAAPFYLREFDQTYNEKGLAQSKLWPPGTLCITIAANIADTAILAMPACFPDSIIGFTADPKESDAKYVKYCLDTYKQRIRAISQGTTQDNLSVEKLLSFRFRIPDCAVQKKIAAVLSAYDDLIENNRRRIALLERMAEQLYREWFVRFRFPGYQQAKFLKGVPLGWETELASQFFGYMRGKSYTSEELSDDPKQAPFITLKSFNRGGGYRADGLKRFSGRHKPEQLVRQNDIVMAVTDMTQGREVIGRAARVPDFGVHGAVISMDVIKLVPKTISASFLYSYLRLSGFGEFIKEFANGTNVLHLKPDLVTRQRITMPPEILRDQFSAIIEPIFEQIDTLSKANGPLEASRDLILPRLISGKLRVDELDIQFPPSMPAG